MNKKLQLKIIVVLCIIIVIFVYFYVSKGFSFNISEDFIDLRDSVGINADEILDLTIIKDIQEKIGDIKEEANNTQDNIESKIAEKVLNKLDRQNYIIYEHEPWGIKFTYDNLMLKELDQSQEKIKLYYENIEELEAVIEKYSLEGGFNDWLNNNYDLQNLNKYEYNDLTFWMQDLSDEKNKLEEYYFNQGEDIFIISLSSPSINTGDYWDSLENIIKSFDLIEDTNL